MVGTCSFPRQSAAIILQTYRATGMEITPLLGLAHILTTKIFKWLTGRRAVVVLVRRFFLCLVYMTASRRTIVKTRASYMAVVDCFYLYLWTTGAAKRRICSPTCFTGQAALLGLAQFILSTIFSPRTRSFCQVAHTLL